VRQKFTLKERDNETGLDYFLARYYSSTQGRFTNPDAPFADQFPQNPQSWNLYSYTRNNPVRVADSDGRITPWDVLDIVSLGLSIRDFWRQPSWKNAGWIALDGVGAALPFVPFGSVRRAAQLADMIRTSGSARNLDNAFEVKVWNDLVDRGYTPIATGENNVRSAVGLSGDAKVADILATTGNKFAISEAKGGNTADIGTAVDQLSSTANALVKNVSGAEISRLEVVVNKGADLGPGYQKSGDQLLKLNGATGKYEPVRIQGKVVHVREVRDRKLPKYLK